MIRSFLAILHDSFRAALASRALYLLGLLLFLIVAGLFPFHVRTEAEWTLSSTRHFPNPVRLASRLVEHAESGPRPAIRKIWERLSPALQRELESIAERRGASREPEAGDDATRNSAEDPSRSSPGFHDDPATFSRLASELNDMMAQSDWFAREDFRRLRLSRETSSLLDQSPADRLPADVRRLNRLLIATALRNDVEMPDPAQLDLYYGPWQLPNVFAGLSQAEMGNRITTQLLYWFDKIVMSVGIFIGILVTASMVPNMLEPGSLNLLLSKPVSRWWLLLSKFAGGCVFIFLVTGLLLSGIWLWLGVQFGVWEPALLYGIPVYTFVFAIYYTISVLTALWFRSVILCIAFAILFWAACFCIGVGFNRLDSYVYNHAPIEMAARGKKLAMVDGLSSISLASERRLDWKRVAGQGESDEERAGKVIATLFARLDETPDFPVPFRPIRDPESGTLLAVEDLPLGQAVTADARTIVTLDEPGAVQRFAAMPPGTRTLLGVVSGAILVMDGSANVWELPMEELSSRAQEADGEAPHPPPSERSWGLPSLVEKSRFVKVSATEDEFSLEGSRSAAAEPAGTIAFYSAGRIVVLQRDSSDNLYRPVRQRELGQQKNRRMSALVEFGDGALFVVFGNGEFFHLDPATLDTQWSGHIDRKVAVRNIASSPDGKYAAVVLRDGRLWIYDAAARSPVSPSRKLSRAEYLSVAFDEDGKLLVANRYREVRAWDLSTGESEIRAAAGTDWGTGLYRYLVRPLYRLFPKPGEFHRVIAQLSSSGDAADHPEIDLRNSPPSRSSWHPLVNGMLFIAVMLGVACLVFQRKDF